MTALPRGSRMPGALREDHDDDDDTTAAAFAQPPRGPTHPPARGRRDPGIADAWRFLSEPLASNLQHKPPSEGASNTAPPPPAGKRKHRLGAAVEKIGKRKTRQKERSEMKQREAKTKDRSIGELKLQAP